MGNATDLGLFQRAKRLGHLTAGCIKLTESKWGVRPDVNMNRGARGDAPVTKGHSKITSQQAIDCLTVLAKAFAG
jgi:hypothetical protein